ncbi:hypothetical protein [Lysobacter sp. CFH 32150]|uniref:hypothetical protein n=1 Tax=Lysobacter sp. CFH 32150 TaxID=2927128 RepID=UPI001FA6CA44|nr:hypothetical protein [Lysobacter sp. CFH 32150]MCI4567878.1 hypothetical protein [Lysobacter sp. CFH 32150]
MNFPLTPGRICVAVGVLVFGVLSLLHGDYVSGLQPLPSPTTTHWWAQLSGFLLTALGACLLIDRTTRWAAFGSAALFLLWCVLIHAPIVIAEPRNGTAWVRFFETFALAGASLVLAGLSASQRVTGDTNDKLIRVGRLCFGVSLPVFAATHFIYADFVATIVPAWIPARLFWAWFTGAAHLAAGLAVLTGIQARLAALLAGAMYGSWALILHVPRVLPDIGNRPEMTNLFVAVALCGAAWIVAASYPKPTR